MARIEGAGQAVAFNCEALAVGRGPATVAPNLTDRQPVLIVDGAVALGDAEKVYHNAEKLLQPAPAAPVGIMTFGSADLLDVPWETIVAGYQQRLGKGRFDTLAEYLDDLVAFIEHAAAMLPGPLRRDRFGNVAHAAHFMRPTKLRARSWTEQLARHRRGNNYDPHSAIRDCFVKADALVKFSDRNLDTDFGHPDALAGGQCCDFPGLAWRSVTTKEWRLAPNASIWGRAPQSGQQDAI